MPSSGPPVSAKPSANANRLGAGGRTVVSNRSGSPSAKGDHHSNRAGGNNGNTGSSRTGNSSTQQSTRQSRDPVSNLASRTNMQGGMGMTAFGKSESRGNLSERISKIGGITGDRQQVQPDGPKRITDRMPQYSQVPNNQKREFQPARSYFQDFAREPAQALAPREKPFSFGEQQTVEARPRAIIPELKKFSFGENQTVERPAQAIKPEPKPFSFGEAVQTVQAPSPIGTARVRDLSRPTTNYMFMRDQMGQAGFPPNNLPAPLANPDGRKGYEAGTNPYSQELWRETSKPAVSELPTPKNALSLGSYLSDMPSPEIFANASDGKFGPRKTADAPKNNGFGPRVNADKKAPTDAAMIARQNDLIKNSAGWPTLDMPISWKQFDDRLPLDFSHGVQGGGGAQPYFGGPAKPPAQKKPENKAPLNFEWGVGGGRGTQPYNAKSYPTFENTPKSELETWTRGFKINPAAANGTPGFLSNPYQAELQKTLSTPMATQGVADLNTFTDNEGKVYTGPKVRKAFDNSFLQLSQPRDVFTDPLSPEYLDPKDASAAHPLYGKEQAGLYGGEFEQDKSNKPDSFFDRIVSKLKFRSPPTEGVSSRGKEDKEQNSAKKEKSKNSAKAPVVPDNTTYLDMVFGDNEDALSWYLKQRKKLQMELQALGVPF